MSQMNEYTAGTFCWVELSTTDAAGAKDFYRQLFGWEFEDQPVGPDAVYTMLHFAGKSVGAMYENPQLATMGAPPSWLSYVSVESADRTADKAKTLGGSVLKDPFDVMDVGRMAVVQDPTGAVFALWQPRKHIGSTLVNEPGAFCWNELMTTDVDQAGVFYTQLFGWGSQTQDMGGGWMYTSFMNGERPAGGMMAITQEMGDVPPNWLVYFAVDDCDETAAKATSLGATLAVPPRDIPEVGKFAVIEDPQGGAFAIIKLNNPQ